MTHNELKIKADFFHMLKVLTPTIRHQVLDALFLFVFSQKKTSLNHFAKIIFDIIQHDIQSQSTSDFKQTSDISSTHISLPGAYCYTHMPFPQLWKTLPYETMPVTHPDVSIPDKICNDILTPVINIIQTQEEPFHPIHEIQTPANYKRVPIEKWIQKQSVHIEHPMAHLPFMRDITPEITKSVFPIKTKSAFQYSKNTEKSLFIRLKRTIRHIYQKRKNRKELTHATN